jgi:hypothetical protein
LLRADNPTGYDVAVTSPESDSLPPPETGEDPPDAEYVSLASATMSPAFLAFLYVVTFGFYTPVLVYRFSKVLREPGRSPWNWALGSIVPCLNLWVLYRLCQELHGRATRAGMLTAIGAGMRVAFIVFALIVATGVRSSPSYLANVFGLLLAGSPFVGIQMLLNRVARREAGEAAPRSRPWVTYALIPIGLVGHGYLMWGSRAVWQRARGEMLASGERLYGTQSYAIHVPSAGWVRVKPGTIGDVSADLEQFGPDVSTSVVVYTYDDANQTLDTRVDDRRSMLGEAHADPLKIREERSFHAPEDLVPTSIARYEQSGFVTWVATFDLRPRFVEVIVSTPRFGYEADAERLVRSVELMESGSDPDLAAAETAGVAGAVGGEP